MNLLHQNVLDAKRFEIENANAQGLRTTSNQPSKNNRLKLYFVLRIRLTTLELLEQVYLIMYKCVDSTAADHYRVNPNKHQVINIL